MNALLSLALGVGLSSWVAPSPAQEGKDDPGKQKEADWKDARWSLTDVGPFMTSALKLPDGSILLRAISVRTKDGGFVFDPETCTIRAAWTGGFLTFSPARYGLIEKPRIAGEVVWTAPPGPAWEGRLVYKGFHRIQDRVVFSYEVGGTPVLETTRREGAGFVRSIELGAHDQDRVLTIGAGGTVGTTEVNGDGSLQKSPADRKTWTIPPTQGVSRVQVALSLRPAAGPGDAGVAMTSVDVSLLAKPGPPLWTPLETKGQRSSEKGPYVVDTLTIPYENPWKALFFLSGVDFFSNGDAAVCTLHGDVWTVSGIDDGLGRLTWRRFATGLYQPLGLRIVNDRIHVLGRDRITRLVDQNQDGEADFYESFSSELPTTASGHDFLTCLETDHDGNFYFVSGHGLFRLTPDGKSSECLATGFRNPNGMSVSPDGVITVAPQEGEWTPASNIVEVKPGGYYGFGGPKVVPGRPLGYDVPLCYMPRSVDNSTGGQAWVNSRAWGPLEGQLLSFSYGHCSMMLVLRDQVDGVWQGGVVPFKVGFASGAHRARFRSQDGQLYVAGTRGWQTSAARDGSLQRVRYTGEPVHFPLEFHAVSGGVKLRFSEPLDREEAESSDSWAAEAWNYHYAAQYGSKDYSVSRPNVEGHDPVELESVQLSQDAREVFLKMPALAPVMQLRIRYSLRGADGVPIKGDFHATVHALGR
jgi:glucose/arabinose dehydrogenase